MDLNKNIPNSLPIQLLFVLPFFSKSTASPLEKYRMNILQYIRQMFYSVFQKDDLFYLAIFS